MSLNTVTLTWDFTDLLQAKAKATLYIRPTDVVCNPNGSTVIAQITDEVDFFGTGELAGIIANDNEGLNPSDAGYGIYVVSEAGNVLYSETVQILYANGATQDLSALTPATTSGLTTYMLQPAGTPAAGDVPVATGVGEESEWGAGGSGSGSVTDVSIEDANGFSGTVADPSTTPQITLETTVSGVLKGASGALEAAVAGTDYLTPSGSGADLTGITVSQVSGAAPLASPALTGTPTAPTQTRATDSTKSQRRLRHCRSRREKTTRAEAAEAGALQKASNLSDLDGASTARTNLGLGSAATQSSSAFDAAGAAATAQSNAEAASLPIDGGTLTGALVPAVVTLSESGGDVAVNAAEGNDFLLTLTASGWTISNPSNPKSGQPITFWLTQGTGGDFTVDWGSAFNFGTTGEPTLSTTAGDVDMVGFKYNVALSQWCYAGMMAGF